MRRGLLALPLFLAGSVGLIVAASALLLVKIYTRRRP